MDEKSNRTTNGGVRSVRRRLFQTFCSEGWIEIDIRRRNLQLLPTTTGLYVGQSTYISPITFLRLSCELSSQTSRPCRPHRHLLPSFATALLVFQVGECFLESSCIRISGGQAVPFAVESYSVQHIASAWVVPFETTTLPQSTPSAPPFSMRANAVWKPLLRYHPRSAKPLFRRNMASAFTFSREAMSVFSKERY